MMNIIRDDVQSQGRIMRAPTPGIGTACVLVGRPNVGNIRREIRARIKPISEAAIVVAVCPGGLGEPDSASLVVFDAYGQSRLETGVTFTSVPTAGYGHVPKPVQHYA